MKQPRKLTRAQKILVSQQGYDPSAFLLAQELIHSLILVDKQSGERVIIEKYDKEGKV